MGARPPGACRVAWFTTTLPECAPHITPLVFVWHEGAPWLRTGPEKQKAPSLAADRAAHRHRRAARGIDVVVEGTAVRETDTVTLENHE